VHARALFRRGNRPAAYRALRSHIDELLDTDNMQGTCVAAIEFINMMAAAGRYQDSAQLLGFLDATGLLDNAAWATLIADTRDTLSTAEPVPHGTPIGDHRQALAYMRRSLDRLLIS
jgi:hypothetical protein